MKIKLTLLIIILIIIPLTLFGCKAQYEERIAELEEQLAEQEDETSQNELSEVEEEEASPAMVTDTEEMEEEATQEEEVADEEEPEEEIEIVEEAPTISLTIYEGPTLDGGICYYRVEATVTGSPSPTVSFSRDDSGGAWGADKAQVNLSDPADTYTLTATATNSEGSATAFIDLSWGCEVPETEPEPEPEPEPEDKDPKPPRLPWNSTTINPSENMSGMLGQGGAVRLGTSPILIGDSESGTVYNGYLSFNISELHRRVVEYAEIKFLNLEHTNHPESFASSVIVTILDYGDSLDASDFAFGGDYLATIPISAPSYLISNDTLIEQLQKVLDDPSRNLFQLKLELNVATNGDNLSDTVDIPSCGEEVWLSIDYWYGN